MGLSFYIVNITRLQTKQVKREYSVNGNAFYALHNSRTPGDVDLISKVFSILTLWMCSAVVAVYALIWV